MFIKVDLNYSVEESGRIGRIGKIRKLRKLENVERKSDVFEITEKLVPSGFNPAAVKRVKRECTAKRSGREGVPGGLPCFVVAIR